MPLVFAFPWLLPALFGLPLLWWLLRVTPPPLRRVSFPAVRLMHGLRDREDKPHRIPWWLLLMRLLAAAVAIVALAGPRWEPEPLLSGTGPLLLVVDNGWSSAGVWQELTAEAEDAVRTARRRGRGVQLLETARADAESAASPPPLLTAGDALKALDALVPRPWSADYAHAAERLGGVARDTDEILFLSDGLGGDASGEFATRLETLGRLSVRNPGAEQTAPLLLPPVIRAETLSLEVVRADAVGDGPELLLRQHDGELLSSETTEAFANGSAKTRLRLPRDILDRLGAVEISTARGAGSVQLLAEDNRLRRVLLWAEPVEGTDSQPLLSPLHYLTVAFSIFAETQRGTVEALASFSPDVVVTDGERPLTEAEATELSRWMTEGGVLLRFAGDGLLREGSGALVPVRLRPAVRALGGALSWEEPVGLAPEPPDSSPLAGLTSPPDLRVSRAVLAEPGPELERRTWAWLEDGSPLITAAERGDGVLVLVHTAAGAEWSNVPISGYFVRLLRRIAELGRLATDESIQSDATLEPFLLLDGFGRLTSPDRRRDIRLALAELEDVQPGAAHPPGLYGSEENRIAINLGGRIAPPQAFARPYGVSVSLLGASRSLDLLPWLLVALLCLIIAEFWAGLRLRGLLFSGLTRARAVTAATLLAALGFLHAETAEAQQGSSRENTQESRIVYVITGDRDTDETSYAALRSLTQVLASRTSVHLGEPFGVRLGVDDLSPYQMIYWPYEPSAPLPGIEEREAMNRYIGQGGMVLLDLRRDAFLADVSFSPREEAFLEGLRLPRLRQVPQSYVLFRSFYLLDRAPGRFDSAALWMSVPDPAADNVAPLFVGTNDWAAAWALDSFGNPTHAIIPGGEPQRELAYRFGVNLVMHALSGSYKADQIHLNAIIERLQR